MQAAARVGAAAIMPPLSPSESRCDCHVRNIMDPVVGDFRWRKSIMKWSSTTEDGLTRQKAYFPKLFRPEPQRRRRLSALRLSKECRDNLKTSNSSTSRANGTPNMPKAMTGPTRMFRSQRPHRSNSRTSARMFASWGNSRICLFWLGIWTARILHVR